MIKFASKYHLYSTKFGQHKIFSVQTKAELMLISRVPGYEINSYLLQENIKTGNFNFTKHQFLKIQLTSLKMQGEGGGGFSPAT